MNIVTSEQVRLILKDNQANLKYIWLTDPAYIQLDFDNLVAVVKACSVKGFHAMGELWDCDNYALQLHARVQAYQYDLVKKGMLNTQNSWAFGECIGIDDGIFTSGVHAVNIAITDKGVALIEPQEDRVWLAAKDEMSLFFVKF